MFSNIHSVCDGMHLRAFAFFQNKTYKESIQNSGQLGFVQVHKYALKHCNKYECSENKLKSITKLNPKNLNEDFKLVKVLVKVSVIFCVKL